MGALIMAGGTGIASDDQMIIVVSAGKYRGSTRRRPLIRPR